MRVSVIACGCVAICAALSADMVSAQGPVRRGLRAAGEATVEGTRRVVQGGANVVGGVAQGAANVAGGVAQGTANVARGVVGGAANTVGAGVDALTPRVPIQARAGANLAAADAGPNARWRMQQHNGEWWYYSPQNNWMYHRNGQWNEFAADSFQPYQQFAGQYSSAYRGPQDADQYGQYGGQAAYQGPTYTLQHDESGREFICDNGRRVYFDEGQGGQQHQVGYGGAGQQGAYGQEGMMGAPTQPTPTPAIPEAPNAAAAGAAVGAGAQTTPGQQGVTGQVDANAQGAGTQVGAATTGTGQTNQAGAGASSPAAPRDINNEPANPPEIGVPTTPGAQQQY